MLLRVKAFLRRAVLVVVGVAFCWGCTGVALSVVPVVPWASQATGTQNDQGNAISTLADGSSIVTGQFSGSATFGSTTLTSLGGSDVFVAKMDASGAWVWAKQAGDTNDDQGRSVSTLADGSSIVTGYFEGSATFGSTTLTSLGGSDAFVAKVDASGTWVWATQAGGTNGDEGAGISTLADGSSIVTGQFSGSATFGSAILTSAGDLDVFVAKVNASGAWVWATRAGGTIDDRGISLSTLTDGSVIVTGYFDSSDAVFGATTLASGGGNDVFVARMDASGAWVWATQAVGAEDDRASSIRTLADGSSTVTGFFRDSATFGSTTLTTLGGSDVFVAKVDASGAWVWATQAGGTSSDNGAGVSTLADGSSMVTGYFAGSATFGSTTLTSGGILDVFVARMDASGAWVWATQAVGTGTNFNFSNGISALADGSLRITGSFGGTATFGSITLTSAGGSSDVFVAKFLDAPQAPAAPVAVAGDGQATVTITPLAGGSVTAYTVQASPGGRTCTITPPAVSCTVTGLSNGTAYTFTVTATNAAGTSGTSAASPAVTPAGPSADPKKDDAVAPKVTVPAASVSRGATLTTVVNPSVAGTVKVTATLRGRTVCTATRKAAKAGRMTVTCRLSPAARAAIRIKPVTLTVTARLTDAAGKTATASRKVKVARYKVRVPVTG